MFGDERASAKEIGKFVFGVASMLGLSGFRDNETADARANVRMCSHPTSDSCKSLTIGSPATYQILAQLATRILRHGDGGARAHVQRCPTQPLTCGKHVLSDAQPKYQI